MRRYRLGETFVKLSKEEAEQRLGESEKSLDSQLDKADQQMQQIQGKMGELKVILKSKFKNSINLEPAAE